MLNKTISYWITESGEEKHLIINMRYVNDMLWVDSVLESEMCEKHHSYAVLYPHDKGLEEIIAEHVQILLAMPDNQTLTEFPYIKFTDLRGNIDNLSGVNINEELL